MAIHHGQVQKFKIPFKGLVSNYHELDFEFNLLNLQAVVSPSGYKQAPHISPIEFSLHPNKIKINSQAQTFLTVSAKVKQQKKKEEQVPKPQPNEVYNHVLVGIVRDTSIIFSFILQVSVIDSPAQ